MTYILHFLPEVEEDVIAGYLWYEGKSSGLGEDFLALQENSWVKQRMKEEERER